MHMGNIFAALMSYASVKSRGGSWLLRIEDLDRQRCKPEYTEQIIDDLEWLGLKADEGAMRKGGEKGGMGPYRQSERDAIYEEAFEQLRAEGCVYECFCSRVDLMAASAPHASDGHTIYSLACWGLGEAERAERRQRRSPAWRFHLPEEESTVEDLHYGVQRCRLSLDRGDFIIRRADGNFGYQLAVVVDDAMMGVNEIVRGRDLLMASHEQAYMLRKMGYEVPRYCHFPLLLAPDGSRLSKRDRSLAMDKIRERVKPNELIGLVGWLIGEQDGWHPMSLEDFVNGFDWGRVPREDIVVDGQELF